MKANELRVGNYVYFHGDVEEINMVDGRGIIGREEQPPYPIEEFEPIPLTEEWLLRFGFEKEYNNMTYITTFNLSDTPFSYVQGKFVVNTSTGDFCVYIDKVHQLQNLYFVLTGEELTIKKEDEK